MQDAIEIFLDVLGILRIDAQRRKDIHDILKGDAKLKSFTPHGRFEVSMARLGGILDSMMAMGVITENPKTKLLEKTSLGTDIAVLIGKGLSLDDIVKTGVEHAKAKT